MGKNEPAINDLAFKAFFGDVSVLTAYEQLKPTERVFVDELIASDDPRGSMVRALANDPRKGQISNARALEFMKRPLVKAAIAERMKAAMDRLEITADRVLQEVALVAFARMGTYVRITDDGEPYTDLSGVSATDMAAIAEVTTEDFTDGRGDDARDVRKVKIKLHDKLSALDKLMKYFSLYAPDKVEISGPGGKPIQTANVTVDMSPAEAAELYAASLTHEVDK